MQTQKKKLYIFLGYKHVQKFVTFKVICQILRGGFFGEGQEDGSGLHGEGGKEHKTLDKVLGTKQP